MSIQREGERTTRPLNFCWCGIMLEYKWGLPYCPRHKFDYEAKLRGKRIKKWSGKSKRYKGKYEDY